MCSRSIPAEMCNQISAFASERTPLICAVVEKGLIGNSCGGKSPFDESAYRAFVAGAAIDCEKLEKDFESMLSIDVRLVHG